MANWRWRRQDGGRRRLRRTEWKTNTSINKNDKKCDILHKMNVHLCVSVRCIELMICARCEHVRQLCIHSFASIVSQIYTLRSSNHTNNVDSCLCVWVLQEWMCFYKCVYRHHHRSSQQKRFPFSHVPAANDHSFRHSVLTHRKHIHTQRKILLDISRILLGFFSNAQ